MFGMVRLAYPDTDVFLLAYSIGAPESFMRIEEKWLPEIKKHVPSCIQYKWFQFFQHDLIRCIYFLFHARILVVRWFWLVLKQICVMIPLRSMTWKTEIRSLWHTKRYNWCVCISSLIPFNKLIISTTTVSNFKLRSLSNSKIRICDRFGIGFRDLDVIFDEEFNFGIEIRWIAITVEFFTAFRFGFENRNVSKNPNLMKNHQKRIPESTSASQIIMNPQFCSYLLL